LAIRRSRMGILTVDNCRVAQEELAHDLKSRYMTPEAIAEREADITQAVDEAMSCDVDLMINVLADIPEVAKHLAAIALVDCTRPMSMLSFSDVAYLAQQAHNLNTALAAALRDYVEV